MQVKSYIKEERKIKAIQHTELCNQLYSNEIKNSIDNSVLFNNHNFNTLSNNGKTNINIKVIASTTSAVALSHPDSCVLNFASYKHPGGGFIIGAIAQEEAICHDSNLYNIIGDSKFEKEYEFNRNHTNHGLYSNWAIYSPNVIFFNDDTESKCNVITCPAPNFSAYEKNNIQNVDYNNILESRIKYILDIAEYKNEKTLILGAFGCGVFKNDPQKVAEIFKKLILSGHYNFNDVIFAIPGGGNYICFNNYFNK